MPSGTKSPAGLLPTISNAYRRKPAVCVPATKRSRVTVSFTWSPLKESPPSKRFARVISRPRTPKCSTPNKVVGASRRSLCISPIRAHEDKDEDVDNDFASMFHSLRLSIDDDSHSDGASCREMQQKLKEKENCIKLLEQQMRMEGNWTVEAIQDDDEKTLFYTGFRSYSDFKRFLSR